MKPRFDDPAARQALREQLAGLGERSSRKSYYPELQQRLAELERFRALLDETSEGIFLLELPDGLLLDVNGTACRQLGQVRGALLGTPLAARLEPPGGERLAGLLVGGADREGRTALATALLAAGGGRIPVELTVRPVWLDGRAFAVVVARDTTERDQLQARLVLADRMVSVGTLAAGVAHEVNNPLAYVVGNLDYARRELEAARAALAASPGAAARLAEADAALADAADGAERVRRIVRDLKIFSRADEEERSRLDVRRVLDAALSLAANEIRHRARLERAYREVPAVLANEGRLCQVFLNLVINAAQAIPEGAADRHLVAVATWEEAGQAVIEIRDTGAGIAAEHLPRIFDPFFTTKPVGVGTGLGLAICHGIVAQLGGAIEVQSQPGRGSSFRIRLPAATGAAEVAPAPPRPVARRAGRILVIDDDPLAGTSLRRLLSPPHDVETCTQARAALARLVAGERFDVVLCDLMMPELSGMDLFAALRAARPEQARRIIFVTAGGFTPRARAFLADAHAPCIEKPVSIPALLAAIDAVAPG